MVRFSIGVCISLNENEGGTGERRGIKPKVEA